MATKMKQSKKARKPKTSKGIHGGGGNVSLTEVQKVLLKSKPTGVFASLNHKRSVAKD